MKFEDFDNQFFINYLNVSWAFTLDGAIKTKIYFILYILNKLISLQEVLINIGMLNLNIWYTSKKNKKTISIDKKKKAYLQ